MRLSTLVLGFLVLVAGAVAFVAFRKVTEDARAWRRLLALEGKDLPKNPEAAALFTRCLRRGAVDAESRASPPLAPWRVVLAGSYVLLLQAETITDVPSEFELGAHVFGEEGNRLSSAWFSGGWRVIVNDAAAVKRAECPGPLLELRSAPTINGPDVARQFYAVVDDRLALVRLEDVDGAAFVNTYYAPNLTFGPRVPDRSPEEWEAALSAANPAEVLRTLVWLGGWHGPPGRDPPAETIRQSRADADLVHAARTRPGVPSRIEELKDSPNSWVREAAALAQGVLRKAPK